MNKIVAIAVILFSVSSFAKRVQIDCEDGPTPDPKFQVTFIDVEGQKAVSIVNQVAQFVVPAEKFEVLLKSEPDITKLVGIAFSSKEQGGMQITEGNNIAYSRETVDITVVVPAKDPAGQPQLAQFLNCYLNTRNQIGFQ